MDPCLKAKYSFDFSTQVRILVRRGSKISLMKTITMIALRGGEGFVDICIGRRLPHPGCFCGELKAPLDMF